MESTEDAYKFVDEGEHPTKLCLLSVEGSTKTLNRWRADKFLCDVTDQPLKHHLGQDLARVSNK